MRGLVGIFSYGAASFGNETSRKKRKYQGEGDDITGKSPDQIVRDYGISRTFQIVRPFKHLDALSNVIVPHVPLQRISKPSKLRATAMSSLLEVDLGEKKSYPALILPHGDLKRLDFARAAATGAKILLLDEPFSGLSAEDGFRITQLIKNANKDLGVTILIVEHKLRLLSGLVDRIVVLDQGKLLAIGTPDEISRNQEVIKSYLGMEASEIVRS
ncbi:MAG: ABC transporter ATP-binding protein C-terminal domain-containing protein [Candidatus Kariarchaeaceae archaeon]